MPNPPKSVSLLKRFVSTSRSIVTNQVELPLGILRLHTNLYWLKQNGVEPLTADELGVVEAYHSQIIDFPLGEERHQWEASALQKEDEELDALTDAYRSQLFSILQRILTEVPQS